MFEMVDLCWTRLWSSRCVYISSFGDFYLVLVASALRQSLCTVVLVCTLSFGYAVVWSVCLLVWSIRLFGLYAHSVCILVHSARCHVRCHWGCCGEQQPILSPLFTVFLRLFLWYIHCCSVCICLVCMFIAFPISLAAALINFAPSTLSILLFLLLPQLWCVTGMCCASHSTLASDNSLFIDFFNLVSAHWPLVCIVNLIVISTQYHYCCAESCLILFVLLLYS